LCPDAPVPVFIPEFRKENKGMAGNVYENLLSLHVNAELLTNEGSVEKTRYVEQNTNHMIVRIDSGEEKIKRIPNLYTVEFEKYDAVVNSDYDKGFLTYEDIEFISTQHPLVFMDTKKILGDWAQKVSFIKINEIEHERTRHALINKTWAEQSLIITRGSGGCFYRGEIFPVSKVEIKDLSGAGDTFLAAMVAKYLETTNIRTSLRFANECATIVVQQKGVNAINDV
jgi:D-glycero-beta-D-manno-heptose-7-phosphate kinase